MNKSLQETEYDGDPIVSLDALKLRIGSNNGTAEDDDLLILLDTARKVFERTANGKIVATRTFTQWQPCWKSYFAPVRLEVGPVLSITHVKYYDVDDVLQEVDTGDYASDLTGIPAYLWMLEGKEWPTLNAYRPRPVGITYTAGMATVPNDIKQAILLLAASAYYANQSAEDVPIPDGFQRLCNQHNTGLGGF
ncbi:head-tail connector protein [Limnoglobus roseus]|uniref:Phage gp6-like head-tail connector protein n=1 Tax=Limnoglobus roseus TaxID=2598579 RepID=A0A5C1ACX3_9BACT|nr:hypothetical protein [Limnoglobus roseus]QEL16550.1 hypothetical protein PX52LOC_03510 [Limnoglobus roseus]